MTLKMLCTPLILTLFVSRLRSFPYLWHKQKISTYAVKPAIFNTISNAFIR